MKISLANLNGMTPNIAGKRVSIYYLNEHYLAKRFHHLLDSDKKEKLERFYYAKEIKDLERVVLPVDTLETENGFCGYIEKIVPGTLEGELTTFSDYLNLHRYDITLEEITRYLLQVCDTVSKCHQYDIINPDMASDGNVSYHPDTKQVYFIDYQDMQVGNITTSAISSFIAADPTIRLPKYHHGDDFTKNIDLYTLAIRYFYYTTKINLPRASFFQIPIQEVLRGSGIENTEFSECLRILSDPYKPNMDIRDSIKEINKQYTLSQFRQGEPRTFIRK